MKDMPNDPIPDLDRRREALHLWRAWTEAVYRTEAERAVCERERTSAQDEALARLREDFTARLDELTKWHDRARSAILNAARLDFLEASADAARDAYEATGLDLLDDDDGEPVLCAHTGVPLVVGDEVVVDEDTGEHFLRAALGLPPREGGA